MCEWIPSYHTCNVSDSAKANVPKTRHTQHIMHLEAKTIPIMLLVSFINLTLSDERAVFSATNLGKLLAGMRHERGIDRERR